MANNEYMVVLWVADNGSLVEDKWVHITHWFQGLYLVAERNDKALNFMPSATSIDVYVSLVSIEWAVHLRIWGIEEKRQNPADNGRNMLGGCHQIWGVILIGMLAISWNIKKAD